MVRHLFCILTMLLFAGVSVAQSQDRVEIFGGYSYMNPDFTGTANGTSGWDVSAAFNVVRHAGILADFSGFSPNGAACSCGAASASIHTYMGGPQASISFGRIKPFAHFLVGATEGSLTHADSQGGGDFSHVTYGVGGGVDVGIDRWLAVRGQADWLHVGTAGNVARISAGLVFRF